VVLSGPVSVCVDRPLLSLDHPFTYDLPEELRAGVGSLVQVPFHGKTIRGWVLGATDDVPPRMLKVRTTVSEVRVFDPSMLDLFRWVSERYVSPLASVIARSRPPRVAGEEVAVASGGILAALAPPSTPLREDPASFRSYGHAAELRAALRDGSGSFVLRPAPEDEVAVAVEAVTATLGGGRTAMVLVPEADPLPATAAAVRDACGGSVVMFLGGDKRERYRMWLDIRLGKYACVIGTRPAVFAPLSNLGLIYVSRESHAQHREERSPRYHVRTSPSPGRGWRTRCA
jgi:primosomal protein N' (replication factor Y)